VLYTLQVRFEVDWSRPVWIEDELVRSGARDAHVLEDGKVAVTVAARSGDEAYDLVRELLARVGATEVGFADEDDPRLVPQV